MPDTPKPIREGSLEAPTRHPIDWQNEAFYDEDALFKELERVFDHCHGCRRCVSLCHAFPTLFDLVDESPTFELDGVPKEDYWKVVQHCYLCDLCFMTKCPYIPPHEWQLDFPHLMLRAKAVKFRKEGASFRDKMLTDTDLMGKFLARPVISNMVNAANRTSLLRDLLERHIAVHAKAWLPDYTGKPARARNKIHMGKIAKGQKAEATTGKVAIFSTCYCNYNEPQIVDDLVAILEHNGVPVTFARKERCCGMPKLELGDLKTVERAKKVNVPALAKLVDEGWDLMAAVPSCALMFRQELPLMFPDDADVAKVAKAFFDPFEYLMLRHKGGKLATDFKTPLGSVAYQAACHQRVQNVGQKTRDVLSLIPMTEVKIIERCTGHDGTYAVKSECREAAEKIVRPVVRRVKEADTEYYGSDCPMAGHHIGNSMDDGKASQHPISLLRRAYGI